MTLPPKEILQDRDLALLSERDLATRWKKSVRTLQRWRAEGYGPRYLRIGASFLYRLDDVLAFEARMCRGGEAQK